VGKLGKTRPDHLGQALGSVHGQIQTFSKPGGSATARTHVEALCSSSEMIPISEMTRVVVTKTNRNRCRGCIICEPSQLLEKAPTSSLAFHGIHVKMVKHIKSESGVGADDTGQK